MLSLRKDTSLGTNTYSIQLPVPCAHCRITAVARQPKGYGDYFCNVWIKAKRREFNFYSVTISLEQSSNRIFIKLQKKVFATKENFSVMVSFFLMWSPLSRRHLTTFYGLYFSHHYTYYTLQIMLDLLCGCCM